MSFVLRPLRRLQRGPVLRIAGLLGAGVLALAWLLAGPTALGGSATYITTFGTSMEPVLHRGDLVVVKPQSSYRVGDIVAYRSESIRTVVLHRIVDREDDRFVFKGDNNTWIDTDRPRADELVGKMTMHLPGAGTHLRRAASPPVVATLASVAFFPLLRGDRRRRKAREVSAHAATPPRPPRQPLRLRAVEPRLLMATAAAAGLLAVAFTRPIMVDGVSDVPFDELGTFSYSGAAPQGGAAYQSLAVSTGQPVFLRLVDELDLAFSYRVSSSADVTAEGDIALRAVLRDDSGWSYPIDLADPAHFDADDARVGGTLDLADVRLVLGAMQMSTGVVRDQYKVVLEAEVTRAVTHRDASTTGIFASSLEFNLDDNAMYLATPGPDALVPSQGGLLTTTTRHASSLTVLGRSLPIEAMRVGAGAFGVIVVGLWLDWLVRARREEESALIERRYRSYLVPVTNARGRFTSVIEVERMADLVRLADHAGAPILRTDDGHYDVVDGSQTFRYSLREPATADA